MTHPAADQSFLDRLEARLARLTGRDRWPAIEARTDSRNVPANLGSYDAFVALLPFTWTVHGKPYATILRASSVRPRALFAATHTTILQYRPSHPGRVYYAPRQLFARSLIAVGTVIVLSGSVALAIILSVRP